MLTDVEIRRRGLVENACDKSYRAASYDLRIGHLIDPKGSLVEEYLLPAQGIVEVISEETVCIPDNVAGLAMVKTGLCQEGILALSIGVIDPGFRGRISSFMINFGKEPRLLQKGEIFLRTTFQALSGKTEHISKVDLSDEELIRLRKRASVEKFDRTFLSVDVIASKSAEQVFSKYRNQALAYVSAVALFLALLTFMLNFGTIWIKWPDGPVAAAAGTYADPTELKRLARENADLRHRLAVIEQRLPPLSPKQQPGATNDR